MFKKPANVTRKGVGLMTRTLLQMLLENPEGIQAQVALAELAKRVPPTDFEEGQIGSGGRRYENVVRFATVDLVKAGWMLKDKGVWTATEAGKEAFEALPDPEAFYKRAADLYNHWKAAQAPDDQPETQDGPEDHTPGQTFEEAEEAGWAEIWEYPQLVDPCQLQSLVAALVEAMRYLVSWIAPPGKDGGNDVLAWTDPLGTKPPRIKIQVKWRKDNIAVDELRSFMAMLSSEYVGLYVTTGGFTRDARASA